jgi:antibiotic biosynthesis monooxygenase (ABM) superfamily enzyme
MAISTLLGVHPTSLVLGETIGLGIRDWRIPLRMLVFTVLVVTRLNWVAMQFVARVFDIHGSSPGISACSARLLHRL